VLATDVPAPAARERRQRQRRVAVAAEAAPVEVGDGREHSGGHFRVASSRRIYRASRQREVTTFGSVEVIGKRVKEVDGRAERER